MAGCLSASLLPSSSSFAHSTRSWEANDYNNGFIESTRKTYRKDVQNTSKAERVDVYARYDCFVSSQGVTSVHEQTFDTLTIIILFLYIIIFCVLARTQAGLTERMFVKCG